MAPSRVSLVERLERLTTPEPNSACVLWLGAIDEDGYGRITVRDYETKALRSYRAHRLVFSLVKGPISSDRQLDHLCRVRSCVNPMHLEIVTPIENYRRGGGAAHGRRQNLARQLRAAERVTCVHGHLWTEATTYRPPRRPLTRVCRICVYDSIKRYNQRKETA